MHCLASLKNCGGVVMLSSVQPTLVYFFWVPNLIPLTLIFHEYWGLVDKLLIWWVGFLPLQKTIVIVKLFLEFRRIWKRKNWAVLKSNIFYRASDFAILWTGHSFFSKSFDHTLAKSFSLSQNRLKPISLFAKLLNEKKMLNHSDVIKRAVIPSNLKAKPWQAKVSSNCYLVRLLVF